MRTISIIEDSVVTIQELLGMTQDADTNVTVTVRDVIDIVETSPCDE
jgi:hypothetical protein